MPKWREVREHLLYSNYENAINDEEFHLLFDLKHCKKSDLPYWNYTELDLDKLCDDERKYEFRFLKIDIYDLVDAMSLLDLVKCYNVLKVDQIECTCIFLKRFVYPCRYLNMVPRFARPVP